MLSGQGNPRTGGNLRPEMVSPRASRPEQGIYSRNAQRLFPSANEVGGQSRRLRSPQLEVQAELHPSPPREWKKASSSSVDLRKTAGKILA